MELSDKEVEELRRPVRRRSRPLRDVLIYLVWKSTDHGLEALSEFFHVTYTRLLTAKVHSEEYLRRNKSLHAKVQEIIAGG